MSRITAIMSLSFAQRYGILCLDASVDEIVVATMQPFDMSWLESLQEFAERCVRRVVVSPEQIKKIQREVLFAEGLGGRRRRGDSADG